MTYPGTIFEWDDQTSLNRLPIENPRRKPLFCALFSSDKGKEEWQKLTGEAFFKHYGDVISFDRHGQPLLQAANAINSGAELLCKRVVAPDSTLANMSITAALTESETPKQATDAKGNLLYLDADGIETTTVTSTPCYLYLDEDGNETTTATDTPVMVDGVTIKYALASATNVKDADEAFDTVLADTTAVDTFVLYTIADTGRGTSRKRFKIVPDYRQSKSMEYLVYKFVSIEGGQDMESIGFNPRPSLIANNHNISLSSAVRDGSIQLTCIQDDVKVQEFLDKVATMAGIDATTAAGVDLLFGYDRRGNKIQNITVDGSGADLQNSFGHALANGTNGSFGEKPFKTEEYADEIVKALNGEYNTVIFDPDKYKIDAIVDALYPEKVKRAIEALVAFREDFVYFRDLGSTELTSIELWEDANKDSLKSKFCATYGTSYDIIDPYSKKQISVTLGYSLARLLVSHFNGSRNLPVAGIQYNMLIPEAIPGTVRFTPVVCPDPVGNQKERLGDDRLNYATYIDERLVIETLYTSQDTATQLIYLNNILAVQEVMKLIRNRCPATRYTMIDGNDFDSYKKEVEAVIEPYKNNFNMLEIVYTQDTSFAANKIFYATLKVIFKDFVQTEWFKIVAMNAATQV